LLDLARAHETTEPERSRILVQQARAVARSENDQPCEAESLYRLASLAHYDGQPGDAFALAVEARDFAMTHDVPLVMAWALNLIGLVHTNSGNHSEALSCCLQALDCYRGTGHRIDEGNMLNTIATIYHELGDTNRAIVNYEAAINANAQLNRPDLMQSLGQIFQHYVLNVASMRSPLKSVKKHLSCAVFMRSPFFPKFWQPWQALTGVSEILIRRANF